MDYEEFCDVTGSRCNRIVITNIFLLYDITDEGSD